MRACSLKQLANARGLSYAALMLRFVHMKWISPFFMERRFMVRITKTPRAFACKKNSAGPQKGPAQTFSTRY
jgi:hypothetical protein